MYFATACTRPDGCSSQCSFSTRSASSKTMRYSSPLRWGLFFGLPAPDAGKPRRGTGMGRDSIRCFPMGGAVLGTDPPELTQNASSDIMQTERENAPAPGLLRMQEKARDCSGKDSGECPRRLSPWIVPEDRPGNGCGARTGSSTGSSTGNLLPAQTRPDPGTAGGLAEIPQKR